MKKALTLSVIFVLAATGAWYLFSRLVWGPVPWPDGSAFYLPSIDLLTWPSRWRMHAQAAFVPSYDQANFNLMPALPLILGIATRWLGLNHWFGAPLAIRVASMPALLLWAWVLWAFLLNGLSEAPQSRNENAKSSSRAPNTAALLVAAAITAAALWDPSVRWGTLVVRTETWIGLAWILCLRELHRLERGAPRTLALWRISATLAMAAYFHFEAAYLIPAAAVGLWPLASAPLATIGCDSLRIQAREWVGRLVGVGWRTVAFLSPWIAYVLLNWGLFVEQMDVQFHRLGNGNRLIANPYLLFHSLFLSLGSPEFTPKIFNVAKAAFWGIVILLTARTLSDALHALERMAKRENPETRAFLSPTVAAAALAFWTTFYLWCTKPEVWFTTLCHLTLWPWLAVWLISRGETEGKAALTTRSRRTLVSLGAIYALFSVGSGIAQQLKTPWYYSWPVYRAWVDCIESAASHTAISHVGGWPRIWQPHVPDVLVELSERGQHYDLTRALDFESRRPLAEQFGRRADVLIFSRWFNLSPDDPLYSPPDERRVRTYEGPERAADIEKMRNETEVPFGPWALNQLPNLEPGAYQAAVCQVGPFWADLRVRVGP